MQQLIKPKKETWDKLIERSTKDNLELSQQVGEIITTVIRNGDTALKNYNLLFDGVQTNSLGVTSDEILEATQLIPEELKQAINLAKTGIEKFHRAQLESEKAIDTHNGVRCWREQRAIEKVGLYIPGGTAPLFSTILMLGIPAQLAGCKEIVLCTPIGRDGKINPAILFTANLVGINKIFKVGGAQAIAAMASGTETIPQVYKIFGPGNQYVTKAKELVQLEGVSIDMPAGPSEVLIIADETGNAEFVAADLLSQAEHGADSQVILLSTNKKLLDDVSVEVANQLQTLPRKEIAEGALENSKSILLENIEECIEFSNRYAPEHLILASEKAKNWTSKIVNAGSVFIGNLSCESFGDYASGTNHTLPTNGFAKNYSGVSVDSFVKKITFQKIEIEGVEAIGEAVELMAAAEGLEAHKRAVSVRLKALKDE